MCYIIRIALLNTSIQVKMDHSLVFETISVAKAHLVGAGADPHEKMGDFCSPFFW